jgi:hypothetical protein
MDSKPHDPLFAFHKLNEGGQEKAKGIATAFTDLHARLVALGCLSGREGAIAMTKLEEACFFAKKAMAVNLVNQDH